MWMGHGCVRRAPVFPVFPFSQRIMHTPQLVAYVYQLVDGEVKVDKARGFAVGVRVAALL